MTLAVTQPLQRQLHSPVWRSESLGPQCASNELPLMKGRGRWMPLLCCLRSGIILGYCAGGFPCLKSQLFSCAASASGTSRWCPPCCMGTQLIACRCAMCSCYVCTAASLRRTGTAVCAGPGPASALTPGVHNQMLLCLVFLPCALQQVSEGPVLPCVLVPLLRGPLGRS